jgi:hypothetical protein
MDAKSETTISDNQSTITNTVPEDWGATRQVTHGSDKWWKGTLQSSELALMNRLGPCVTAGDFLCQTISTNTCTNRTNHERAWQASVSNPGLLPKKRRTNGND